MLTVNNDFRRDNKNVIKTERRDTMKKSEIHNPMAAMIPDDKAKVIFLKWVSAFEIANSRKITIPKMLYCIPNG